MSETLIIFCDRDNIKTENLLKYIKNNIQILKQKFTFKMVKVSNSNINKIKELNVKTFPSILYKKRVFAGYNSCMEILMDEEEYEFNLEAIAIKEAEKFSKGDKGEEDEVLGGKLMARAIDDLKNGKSIYNRDPEQKLKAFTEKKTEPKIINDDEEYNDDSLKDYMINMFKTSDN